MPFKNRRIDNIFVLYIDDEEISRRYFTCICEKDFKVKTFEDGASALKYLVDHSDQVGVIVTDQKMPGMKGTEVVKVLKEKYSNIVPLLTTAFMDQDDIEESLRRGEIFRYLLKPWNIDELLISLHDAVQAYCDGLEDDNPSLHKTIGGSC